MISGFAGGLLFLVLKLPEGYIMAPGLFGILVAVRSNMVDAQQQSDARFQTLQLAAQALDARDRYTESHSERVADLAAQIADGLEMSGRQIEQIKTAGALHDLGKIGVRDDILNKAGELTEDEWEEMRRHPNVGADMIAKHSALASVAPMVRSHHERWNGSGYPAGLTGESIPLGARILAVADSFDTIISPRIYRLSAMTHEEAVDDITARSGTWYDPVVVKALRQLYHAPVLLQEEAEAAPAFRQRGAMKLLWTRPRFARLLLGTTVSSLGDPLTTVAALILVYQASHDARAVAGTYIVKALATILIGGIAGSLPDRVPRLRLIFLLELARAAILLAGGILTIAVPAVLQMWIWWILPALFLLAAINAVVQPARQAAIPELVEPRELGPANASLTAAGMIASAAGYALAGVLIWLTTQISWLFVVDGVTFALAGLLILGLGDLGGGVRKAGLLSGVARTWAVNRARVHLVIAAFGAFFLTMSFPTLIALAFKRVPDNGAQAYTLLEVMLASGIVAGSILVGRMRNVGTMRTVAQGLAITGIVSIGVALSPWFWLIAVLLLIASLGNPIYQVGNVTALMEATDSSNRGAVLSSRFALTQLAMVIGTSTGGFISAVVGPEATYATLGVGLLGLAAVAGVLQRGGERPGVSEAEAAP